MARVSREAKFYFDPSLPEQNFMIENICSAK